VARPINKKDSHWALANVSFAYGVLAALFISASGCSHVVPSHSIPAKPEFIRVGVQTGDSVEITTKDGEYREFVVEDVGPDAIEGPSETIRFSEIESIVKR
jgi:hypothetical protein